MKKTFAAVAIVVAMAATPAMAQDRNAASGGLYVGALAGYEGLSVDSGDGTVTADGDSAVYGVTAGYDLLARQRLRRRRGRISRKAAARPSFPAVSPVRATVLKPDGQYYVGARAGVRADAGHRCIRQGRIYFARHASLHDGRFALANSTRMPLASASAAACKFSCPDRWKRASNTADRSYEQRRRCRLLAMRLPIRSWPVWAFASHPQHRQARGRCDEGGPSLLAAIAEIPDLVALCRAGLVLVARLAPAGGALAGSCPALRPPIRTRRCSAASPSARGAGRPGDRCRSGIRRRASACRRSSAPARRSSSAAWHGAPWARDRDGAGRPWSARRRERAPALPARRRACRRTLASSLSSHMGQRLRHAVEERLGTDEAVVGQQVGAVGEVFAAAEADLEMQRADLRRTGARPSPGLPPARRSAAAAVDQFLLPGAQRLADGAAVEPVERGRIAVLVCCHAALARAAGGVLSSKRMSCLAGLRNDIALG